MSIQEKTRTELEHKIDQLDRLIAKNGFGSNYLAKAERAQRDLNLALLLGATTAILGLTAWSLYRRTNN